MILARDTPSYYKIYQRNVYLLKRSIPPRIFKQIPPGSRRACVFVLLNSVKYFIYILYDCPALSINLYFVNNNL